VRPRRRPPWSRWSRRRRGRARASCWGTGRLVGVRLSVRVRVRAIARARARARAKVRVGFGVGIGVRVRVVRVEGRVRVRVRLTGDRLHLVLPAAHDADVGHGRRDAEVSRGEPSKSPVRRRQLTPLDRCPHRRLHSCLPLVHLVRRARCVGCVHCAPGAARGAARATECAARG